MPYSHWFHYCPEKPYCGVAMERSFTSSSTEFINREEIYKNVAMASRQPIVRPVASRLTWGHSSQVGEEGEGGREGGRERGRKGGREGGGREGGGERGRESWEERREGERERGRKGRGERKEEKEERIDGRKTDLRMTQTEDEGAVVLDILESNYIHWKYAYMYVHVWDCNDYGCKQAFPIYRAYMYSVHVLFMPCCAVHVCVL